MPPRKFKPLVPGQAYAGQTFTPGSFAFNGQSPAFSPAKSVSTSKEASPAPASSQASVNLDALSKALDELQETELKESFLRIKDAKKLAEIKPIIKNMVDLIVERGPASVVEYNIYDSFALFIKMKSNPLSREAYMLFLSSLSRQLEKYGPGQAYLAPFLTVCFDLVADKDSAVKDAAQASIRNFQDFFTPEALASSILVIHIERYLGGNAKYQSKLAACKFVTYIIETVPQDYLDGCFIHMVPTLTHSVMHDFKPEVAKEGTNLLKLLMSKLDNQDIIPRIDIIVKALADPKKVSETIKTLSSVTFVTDVTESSLAVLVPILSRALGVFASQDALRQTVIVTENLTRLVHNPIEIRPFIPALKPGISTVVNTASLPEVRELAARAQEVLLDAENGTGEIIKISLEEARKDLVEANSEIGPELLDFYSSVVHLCVNCREFERLETYYTNCIGLSSQEAHDRVAAFQNKFADTRVPDVVEDGIEIVNTKFSLAYGSRMLLNKTTLRLYKGRRYGLCGRNGAGKSTLMRAIVEGKVEGFPDKSELRTCFVEHRLQGEDADLTIVDFIAQDKDLKNISKQEIADALLHVGFSKESLERTVGSLSGGWKMKLELARAMLMKADILLLDEPTNHLDVKNVAWLVEYLNTHTDITSLIVSHDSGFLDAVCTDIIHYESKKLVYYKGNLSEFVKVKPEGKAYYTLTDSNVKMAFPSPGILSGVRSNTRAIARLSNVTFQYPGASKPSLSGVSCSVCLASRVAVLGPNGAGKSTLIKLLTGELAPTEGTVEKHPNLRIGYIAQHAFEHIEKHKEKTPNQYLQWRYRFGDDREVHLKQTRQMSEEEQEAFKKPIDLGDGGRLRVLQALIGRQKLKKSFQYECQWVGFLPKHNTFMPREELIERGFGKLVQAFDDHEASREGLGYRELTPPVIRQHFEDIGLDGEIADHTVMGSLSGGQLVKVVIAGATWNNPHLLVLDEPTNYLDRDSLGGLAVAIRDWSGGVLLISHNDEFVGALCPEQWIINDGKMVQKGRTNVKGDRFDDFNNTDPESTATSAAASAAPSTSVSAAPSDSESPLNIKVRKKKKKLTRNEQKEREVRRRLRYLEWLSSPKGTPKPQDSDSE